MTPAIANDGQIVANFTDTLSLAANISGAGTLGKAGSGTLILTGNNTYTGGTTVTGGGTAAAIGNGAITLNGGGLQWAPATSPTSPRAGTLDAVGAPSIPSAA